MFSLERQYCYRDLTSLASNGGYKLSLRNELGQLPSGG